MKAALRAVLHSLGTALEWFAAFALEWLGSIRLLTAILLLVVLFALHALFAFGVQRSTKRAIKARVEAKEQGPFGLGRGLLIEALWSPIGPLILPFYLVSLGVSAIRSRLAKRDKASKKPATDGASSAERGKPDASTGDKDEGATTSGEGETSGGNATPEGKAKPEGNATSEGNAKPAGDGKPAETTSPESGGGQSAEEAPRLVVGHGPIHLLAALVTFGLLLGLLVVEPLLRARMGYAPGQPVYDTLVLGRLPAAALALPLQSNSSRALVLVGWSLLLCYSLTGRILRVAYRASLHANRIDAANDPGFLPFWRQRAAHEVLHRSATSFDGWAFRFFAALLVLLVVALLGAEQLPYRVPAYLLGLGFALASGWLLNLTLAGERVDEPEKKPEEPAAAKPAPLAGWPEVLAELNRRHPGFSKVAHAQPPRVARRPDNSTELPRSVAPGLTELLPQADKNDRDGSSRKLNAMQATVLERFAAMTQLARNEASTGEALELAVSELQLTQAARTGLSLVAREGSGRTTLALLVAVDHTLSCGRSSIVVVPSDAHADRFAQAARTSVAASSIRWNVRVRRMGVETDNDLASGVVPDLLVASPADLLGNALHRKELLDALGMVVIDDAEELAGPVETHVQLALRRLFARLRAHRAAHDVKLDTRVLVMSGPSMADAHLWHEALAPGVEYGDPLVFLPEAEVAPVSPGPVPLQSETPPTKDDLLGEEFGTPAHVFHDLSELRVLGEGEGGRSRLRIADILAACEHVGAPWLYRATRDGERSSGTVRHQLPEEPRHRKHVPAEAAVVLLEGPMTAVQREQDRLAQAGSAILDRLSVPVIGFVRMLDADEAWIAAEARREEKSSARTLLDSFPRPVATHAVGLVRERHLADELSRRSVEIEEIVKVYGVEPVDKLRDLAREELVRITPTREVTQAGFRDRVYVELQSRAIREATAPSSVHEEALFAPPPTHVDEACIGTTELRDPQKPDRTWRVDERTAHRRYYPHAIFDVGAERYEVTGRTGRDHDDDEEARAAPSVIHAEPRADDLVSLPLRRAHVLRRGAAAGTLGGLERIPRKRIQFGRCPLELESATVDVITEHVATMHASPDGRAVKNRMVFSKESPDRARGQFQTAGLFLFPEPDPPSPGTPRLDREGMRVLAALLRVALASAYRRGDRNIEVLLQLDPAGELSRARDREQAREVCEDEPHDRAAQAIGLEDAIVLIDAQEGGNGATRAVARDGLETLLLAVWGLVHDQLPNSGDGPIDASKIAIDRGADDTRWRWLILHDDLAPDDDELDEIELIGHAWAERRWNEHAPKVAAWIRQRVDLESEDWLGETRGGADGDVGAGRTLVELTGPERDPYAAYGVYAPNESKVLGIVEALKATLGVKEDTVQWTVAHLDAIFEWMHAHIKYERDEVQFGKPEHVAPVEHLLQSKRGDCEDMALLFASIAHHFGAKTRAVLIPGHALCQVELEHRDPEAVVDEILRLDVERARERGLLPHHYPNMAGEIAKGWSLSSDVPPKFSRSPAKAMFRFQTTEPEILITVDPDGKRWLCVDEAQSRILGRVDTYRVPEEHGLGKEQAVLDEYGRWALGTHFVDYHESPESTSTEPQSALPPAEKKPLYPKVFRLDAQSSQGDDASAPPPKLRPRPDELPPMRRGPRAMPSDDLGSIFSDSVPGARLVWRRLRWTFSPSGKRSATRRYVLDLGSDAATLSGPIGHLAVGVPKITPEGTTRTEQSAIPARVRERAMEAVQAIELARPTLETLAGELKRRLDAMRLDTDDEAAEADRAESLIARIVDESCLRSYRGSPRTRVRGVAFALATGTTDHWGRTVLHAYLRSMLCKSAKLAFDERGWPSLLGSGERGPSASPGLWVITFQEPRA
jgi:hypothetical protein